MDDFEKFTGFNKGRSRAPIVTIQAASGQFHISVAAMKLLSLDLYGGDLYASYYFSKKLKKIAIALSKERTIDSVKSCSRRKTASYMFPAVSFLNHCNIPYDTTQRLLVKHDVRTDMLVADVSHLIKEGESNEKETVS